MTASSDRPARGGQWLPGSDRTPCSRTMSFGIMSACTARSTSACLGYACTGADGLVAVVAVVVGMFGAIVGKPISQRDATMSAA